MEKMYSISEIADSGILGYKSTMIRRFIYSGKLRHIKIGKGRTAKILVPESAITEFLKAIEKEQAAAKPQ